MGVVLLLYPLQHNTRPTGGWAECLVVTGLLFSLQRRAGVFFTAQGIAIATINHAARLDLAAGDRWLIALTWKPTADWLNTTTPVLDYANAKVSNR